MDHMVALVQGIYFLVTGIWPLISMRTFLTITGPKTDLWLVKTVGLVLAVIGAVLISAQRTAAVNHPLSSWRLGPRPALCLWKLFMS